MLDTRLTSLLERKDIPYCLIGGLAMATWDVARPLDWLWKPSNNPKPSPAR